MEQKFEKHVPILFLDPKCSHRGVCHRSRHVPCQYLFSFANVKIKARVETKMCFSERVSWLAFGTNGFGVARALQKYPDDKQKRTLAYTLGFIGSMQGFEALLWRDPKNHTVAAAAMMLNHAQPLVFWALSSKLHSKSIDKERRARNLATLYSTVAGAYTATQLKENLVTQTPCGLLWEWNYGRLAPLVYALYLASCLATLDAYYDDSKTLSIVFLTTFAASAGVYRHNNMIGSMWCFYSAFLPWLL